MTSKVMIENLNKCWENTSKAIQMSIGEEYFQSVRTYIKHNLDVARDKPHEVVEAIMDAVTLERVSSKYLCTGFINWMIIWVFKLFPDEWMDPLVGMFTTKVKPNWVQPVIN